MGTAAILAGSKPLPATAGAGSSGQELTASVDNAAIAATLERLRDDGGYQLSLPPQPPPPQMPDWLEALSRAIGEFFEMLGPLFTVLFWVLVAALLLGLLWVLVPGVREWLRDLMTRRRQRHADDVAEDWHPHADAARNLLAEADALAAAGRYGDAVRLLLGRSLEDIERRRPGLLQPAMTARMIAAEQALPAPARSAFAELAATVERALFALRAISADEWRAARESYGRFALRDQWVSA